MLSLAELRRAARILDMQLRQAKLQKIVQLDDETVVLGFYGWDDRAKKAARIFLKLCCAQGTGRVSLLRDMPAAPPWPPEFAAYLRSQLQRVKCGGVRIVNEDRQLAVLLEGKAGGFEMLLSLLGPRSNLYLLDLEGRVLQSARPLSSTRSDLRLGEAWTNPPKTHASEGDDRFAEAVDEEFLYRVELHYAEQEAEADREATAQRAERLLARELKDVRRKLRSIEEDIRRTEEADHCRRMGEALKPLLGSAPRGAREVRGTDFETGEEVTIALDPRLTALENMELYFRRWRKLHRGAEMLPRQAEQYRARESALAALVDELQTVGGDPEKVAAFLAQEEVSKIVAPPQPETRRPPKKRPEKKALPGKMQPRRYRSSDGLEVWVGKSDEGNDYLTTRLAGGNDLFFHVEGWPGSHTVLRTGGRKDPPQESLLEAAELCVHFSKMKNASRVNVHVAPIKAVTKPKGAKPGLVHVHRGHTIDLRRSPARLEKILSARIDA